MSRIDEAIKRAQAGSREAVGKSVPSSAPGATVPAPELFRDPWTMQQTSTAPSPADAEESPAPTSDPAVPHPAAVWEALLRESPRSGAGMPVADAPPEKDEVEQAAPAPAATSEHRSAVGVASDGAAAEQPGAESASPVVPQGLALFQGFNPAIVEKIVATPEIRPAFAEQYRKLAGVLHHAQLERDLKVVMITSAVAGEGKTLTATNLALTFSESYRRSVLLIDADLRRPTLHETFQVPNVSGLGDGLRADKEEKLPVVQVSPRLTLLTAGRPDPDPMGGLTSGRMRRVIEEARTRFDWVIVDTPPVGLLPDAKLLAEMADVALLVVQAGSTPYGLVQRAVSAIGREKILGVVLNRADDMVGQSGYGYYSYYDGYGSDK